MSSIDKLLKSVDGIRSALKSTKEVSGIAANEKLSGAQGDNETSKREKMAQVTHIVEALTASCRSPGVVVDSASVARALSPCCELLLLLCDDADADVRSQANDGLTKCIRMLMLTHSGRIENELYKEIKKNGNARSLRAALSRFGIVAPRIRIPKRRAYAANMASSVMRICHVRGEESVWETLVTFFNAVWPTLGPYFLESESRKVIRTLFGRLRDESAPLAVRRSAGQCITAVCKFAKDPEKISSFVLDLIADEGVKLLKEENGVYLHSCLMLMRCLMPVLAELPVEDASKKLGTSLRSPSASESSSTINSSLSSDFVHSKESIRVNQYLLIYEVGLRSTQSRNPSICTAALELLQVILASPPSFFAAALKDPGGIGSQSRLKDEESNSVWDAVSVAASSIGGGGPKSMHEDASISVANDDLESVNNFLVGPRKTGVLTTQRSDDVNNLLSKQSSLQNDQGNDVDLGTELGDGRHSADGAYCALPVGTLDAEEADGFPEGNRLAVVDREDDEEDDKLEPSGETVDEDFGPSSGAVIESEEELGETLLPGKPNRTFGDVGSFHFPEPQIHFCARVVGNSFLIMTSSAEKELRKDDSGTNLVPDSLIRVSLQALALAVLSNISRMEPRLLQLPVNVGDDRRASSVTFEPLLELCWHRDPSIRANLAGLCGSLIRSALAAGLGQTAGFLGVPFAAVWDPLAEAVFDDSPVVSRAGLKAVALVADPILRSDRAQVLLKMARQLPTLARDSSYWLVKVELLSVIAEIPTAEMEFLLKPGPVGLGGSYRERCMENVVLPLLSDENPKVRSAAAKALIQIAVKTPDPADVWDGSPVSASAAALTPSYRDPLSKKSLSRVVTKVFELLHQATAPETVLGALEALAELSKAHSPRTSRAAWFCTPSASPGRNCQAMGYLGLLINLTTNRAVCSDLNAVTNLVTVATSIFEGLSLEFLKPPDKDPKGLNISTRKWEALNHPQMEVIAQLLLSFLVRILCMSAACVSDTPPAKAPFIRTLSSKEMCLPSPTMPVAPSPKLGDVKATSSGSITSPVKRMIKAVGVVSSGSPKMPEIPSGAASESDDSVASMGAASKIKRQVSTACVGAYSHLPEILRLHEVVRGIFDNYKVVVSQEQRAEKKLMNFLKETFEGFGRVVEFATASELGQHSEEILSYVQALMPLCPAPALKAVEQLLHCLFCSNMGAVGEKERSLSAEFLTASANTSTASNEEAKDPSSFYQAVFGGPYRTFATIVRGARNGGQTLENRPADRALLIRTGPSASRAHFSNYIRLFEPIVIYSLKVFTSTPEVTVQTSVLSLLVTLIRLRVNYHLLDNEQVFLNYVLRQFELVEEGLMAGPECPVEQILPWLLRFLVLLSHDSIHSKGLSLIPFSKLIQLCDGLMAAEFNKETHCLPAMGPLVEDLFMWRQNPASKDKLEEQDTQKEVVLTMLARLLPSVQVVRILTLALTGLRDSGPEETYKRTSRHMLDALLPGMAKFDMNMDSVEDAKTVSSFFAALSPSAFRPLDAILRLMVSHPSPEKFRRKFPRWLAGVACCLGVIVVHGNEEGVLSRLIHADLVSLMGDESGTSNASDGGDWEDNGRPWIDPLGVALSPEKGTQLKKKSEERAVIAFARFFLDTLALAGKETSFRISAGYNDVSDPAVSHVVNLLMHVSHMVQSGEFRKTAAALREILTTDTSWEKDLHEVMVKLGFVNPVVTLYWMNLLSLLNCGRVGLWSRLLKGGSKGAKGSTGSEAPCCSKELLRTGTLIVYCDFVHENLVSTSGCGEELTWLLVNHLKALVCLHKEPPVADLVAALNRNSVTSLLFVHAIRMRLNASIDEPRVARGVLACLTDCPAEIGFGLLELCVHVLMPARILAVSYKGFRLAESTVNLITEDEERHRARSAAGSLGVPHASAMHSDYSEEEEEDEDERRKRASARKMMRLLELQDVKVADFDALIVRCEDAVIKKRYPDFADKLRRLRILAFGTAGLDGVAPQGELRWKSYVDDAREDGEVAETYSRPENYPGYRRSVDGVIAAALRRNDQVTVEAAAALVSGLTLDDAVERMQDEDFPMTALPALLWVEDPVENEEQGDLAEALFLEQRARGGMSADVEVKPNADDESYSSASNSTGPFGDITGDSQATESINPSMTETASSSDLQEGIGLNTRRLPVVKGPPKTRRKPLHIKAAVGIVVGRKIEGFLKTLPLENEVFMPTSWNPTETEMDYTESVLEALYVVRRTEALNDGSGDGPSSLTPHRNDTINVWSTVVIPLCECAVALPSTNDELDPRSVARLVLAAFEGAKTVAAGDKWRRRSKSGCLHWTLHDVVTTVSCAGTLLCRPWLWKLFADDETWTVSMIEAVFAIVDVFSSTGKAPRIETLGKEIDSVEETDQGILSASIKASRLALWAHRALQSPSDMTSIDWSLVPVVVAVCRFPSVYGFVRIPAELLPGLAFVPTEVDGKKVKQKFVWRERYETPTDALHDPEVLMDYLWRLHLLGWTNRTDFEESWMALLAVISTCVNATSGGEAGDVQKPFGESPPSPAENAVLARAGALGLAGIGGLLRQTLLLPVPGFPFASEYRNSPDHNETRTKLATGYASIPWTRSRHSSVDLASLDFVLGTMRLGRDSLPGSPLAKQIHLGKLPTWTGPGQEISLERKQSLQALGIDVHSCVQFLSDLLSQWTRNHRNLPPILLFEILKTKAVVLDLVTEFGQVQVLHDSFVDFKRTYATPEDELVVPYVVMGLARTTAILASRSVLGYEGGKVGEFPEPTQEEIASWEVMRDCVIQALRGIPLASQVSGLQACQMLMETKWAKLLFMTTFPILPDYLRLNLIGAAVSGCYLNERHVTSVWGTSFNLLKDFSTLMAESDLQTQVHLVCLEVISSVDRISSPIARLIEGVMQLARVQTLDVATRDLLIKVCSRHFGRVPLSVAVPVSCLQLVLLNTYDILQSESCGDIAKEHVSNEISLVAQEWVNHVFARMGTRSVMEAEQWAKILPNLPENLIPSTELVNKLLSEFISSKQGHVVQVAAVLMRILGELPPDEAIEWCLLSVGAFLQRSPLSVALWFVTTLLLSVCVAQWTVPVASFSQLNNRATFLGLLLKWHWSRPPVAFRHQDFWLLSLAVKSFVDMLKSPEQVKMVLSAFSSVCDGQDEAEAELKPALLFLVGHIRSRVR